MSEGNLRLAADRANRDAARALFAERLAWIKADLAARGVGARVADTVKDSTSDAIGAGLDVAKERKGLVAGTLGALVLWLCREPLFDGAAALLARLRGDGDDDMGSETEDETSDQD